MKIYNILILTILGLVSGIISSTYYYHSAFDLARGALFFGEGEYSSIVPGLAFGIVLAVFFFFINKKDERSGALRYLLFIFISVIAFVVAWWVAYLLVAFFPPALMFAGIPAGAIGGLLLLLGLRVINVRPSLLHGTLLILIAAALGALLPVSFQGDVYNYKKDTFDALIISWQTGYALFLGLFLYMESRSASKKSKV